MEPPTASYAEKPTAPLGVTLAARRASAWALALLAVVFGTLLACALAASTAVAGEAAPEGAEGFSAAEPAAVADVFFFDVGQGDCELVMLPGFTMLVDAGDGSQIGAIVSYMRDELGISSIDCLVATHPHADHIGGVPDVLAAFDVAQVVAPEVGYDSPTFTDFVDAVAAEGLQVTPAVAGTVLYQDESSTVEVLWPNAGWEGGDVNDASAVVRVTFGQTTYLFTGDASYKALLEAGLGHADVLKVPHHGSNTSTSIDLLEGISPSVAVIEVGIDNDYGLPSRESIDELEYCGVQTWRTDRDGTVIVSSDGVGVFAQNIHGAVEPVVVERVDLSADDGTRTVYVTRTGSKYHDGGCRFVNADSTAITLGEALERGYEACGVCGG